MSYSKDDALAIIDATQDSSSLANYAADHPERAYSLCDALNELLLKAIEQSASYDNLIDDLCYAEDQIAAARTAVDVASYAEEDD